MDGKELLELTYDILANNDVSDEDRKRVTESIQYVDYDNYKIVFGSQTPKGVVETMDFRLYDHEEG